MFNANKTVTIFLIDEKNFLFYNFGRLKGFI